jgi:hypothetical protein
VYLSEINAKITFITLAPGLGDVADRQGGSVGRENAVGPDVLLNLKASRLLR